MNRFTTIAATGHALSVAAMEEASRTGQRTADLDHLFLALVITEQTAGQVLRGMGITLDDAREAVSGQHSAQLASLGVTAEAPESERIVFHETGGYEWSERAVALFGRASSKRRIGDASAVLEELLVEPSGMIEDVLQRLGTSPDAVRARLDEAERIPVPSRPKINAQAMTGTSETFVPAAVADVWALVSDPARLPEWEPGLGEVDVPDEASAARPGDTWTGRARTHGPDGKPLRIKPQFRNQRIELLTREEDAIVEWRSSYPDAPNGNSRRIRIALEPAAGGTHVRITHAWIRNPNRRRVPVLGLFFRPLMRLVIWLQLSQVGANLSRAFR